MKTQLTVAWLRYYHAVCHELSAIDTEEWAFEPERGWPSFISEGGLLITLRRQETWDKPRVLISGCFPREMWGHTPQRIDNRGRPHFKDFTITVGYRTTPEAVAKHIWRRLLPDYRLGYEATTRAYIAYQQGKEWERTTLRNLISAYQGYEVEDMPWRQATSTFHAPQSHTSGTIEVQARYGVQLQLENLTKEQADHILVYLRETQQHVHQPQDTNSDN